MLNLIGYNVLWYVICDDRFKILKEQEWIELQRKRVRETRIYFVLAKYREK